ncbi:MAG: hypothetical protein EOO46_19245 [Flavobacterium sp.]|nr:MAG: hypothetical protein EOO46_19245 [Flavobacterium sp.]
MIKYHYQVPKEITNGNVGIKIAFDDFHGVQLYYNSKAFAHQLPASDGLIFVYFSKDLKCACFYEIEVRKSYKLKVIDFLETKIFELDLDGSAINLERFCFFFKENLHKDISTEMQQLQFIESYFINDNLKSNIFNRWKSGQSSVFEENQHLWG